jgi:hypothetical protein
MERDPRNFERLNLFREVVGFRHTVFHFRETLNKFCVIHRDSRYIAEKEQSTANHEAKDIGDGKRL